jgi:hypothetical protein
MDCAHWQEAVLWGADRHCDGLELALRTSGHHQIQAAYSERDQDIGVTNFIGYRKRDCRHFKSKR